LANKIAIKKELLKKEEANTIRDLLKKIGLPTVTIKKPKISDLRNDKKRKGSYINLVLPTKIGKAIILKEKC